MMLFVAGLAGDFDDVDLKEMFELYGEVASAKLITDRNTGKSKGFGFVDMPNEAEAKETIATLDGVSISRKKISVKEAEAQQNRPQGGGGYNSGGYNNSRSYNNSGGGYGNSGGGYNSGGGQRPRKPYTPGGGSGGGYNRDRNSGGGYNSGGYNRDNNSGGGYNRDNGGGYNSGGFNRDRNNDDNRGNRSDDDFNKRY